MIQLSLSWVWRSSRSATNTNWRTSIISFSTSGFFPSPVSLYVYLKTKYNCFHHGTTCHSVGRLVGWGTIESNRIDYPSQVKSKWMHRNEKIHACFAFLYLLYYMFPFLVSPSFFLSLFIFTYLCLLYIMERNCYGVCLVCRDTIS